MDKGCEGEFYTNFRGACLGEVHGDVSKEAQYAQFSCFFIVTNRAGYLYSVYHVQQLCVPRCFNETGRARWSDVDGAPSLSIIYFCVNV